MACAQPVIQEERQAPIRRTMPEGNRELQVHQTQDFETRRVRFLEEGLAGNVEMERITPQTQNPIKQEEYSVRSAPAGDTLSEKDFAETRKALSVPAQTPQAQQTQTPAVSQVIEITGGERRRGERDLLPPSITSESKFIISTSPSYEGIYLEEARGKLEKFGNVRIVKEGDKSSLKLIPRKPLTTEAEAKALMREIIKTSFFDVYIETL